MVTKEHGRLKEGLKEFVPPWRKWGPYVSERSWCTVREDYSLKGDTWGYFDFDQSHKTVYRWGEDGIAGWCDRYQILTFAPAFWNGKDPILKEKLFGLTPKEGNHGEDVKEFYYHLDALPSHAYMKYLYKYPQGQFPYKKIREAKRDVTEPEFEIFETDAFASNAYFDIFIEYAKTTPEDIYIRIEAFNRGSKAAPLHVIPQLWFRNQWSWTDPKGKEPNISLHSGIFPCLKADDSNLPSPSNLSFDYHLNKRYLYGMEGGKPLFTNNENKSPLQPFAKDAFHQCIVNNNEKAVAPNQEGTKAALHYFFPAIKPGQSEVLYLRLTDQESSDPFASIESIFIDKRKEADDFYTTVHPPQATAEEKMIQRQALAGMLWTKQIYLFDVNLWLKGDAQHPSPHFLRNIHWRHLNSMRILSMPDKWEYPWFAAWDTAFHVVSLGLVDIEFAKEQINIFLFDQFQHPNGAIPAYEWDFSDLNPPVQAWAILQLYAMQKKQTGVEDKAFIKKCFLKLLMNFAYWVNKVDNSGCNVFEGGFLGLDNIALFDRSLKLEEGAVLKQSDGTGWMAMFSLNMMRLSLILAEDDSSYEVMGIKFFQHFVHIANAMKTRDNKPYHLWSEKDGFFYDVLVYPDGHFAHFPVRSLVGLIPLFAIEIITENELNRFPEFKSSFNWYLKNHELKTKDCIIPSSENGKANYVLTLVNEEQLPRILHYLLDPNEFLSPFGIRSLSKYHLENPFRYKDLYVHYEPAEAIVNIKGGNSNWRGPVWFPLNFLLIQSLSTLSKVFNKSGKLEAADLLLANRLISIFTKDKTGRRPFFGEAFPFSKDPHFQNNLWFFEYFQSETGQGLGASHQTGWTGLVANLIDQFRK